MEFYNGYIIGLDGRPVKVPYEHQLLVYELQGDEAIMMSAAYIRLFTQLSKKYVWGKQWGIVCFYHDEYTIECDPDCRRCKENFRGRNRLGWKLL